jgi:glycosyltransferase involved in cell wall biosynthesis
MKARIIQPQRKRDCVLSIGMIVKNEEKWLERCLSALKPLRDAVETELVIVDTGSVDRTVKIAEKFTDKIHHFEWVDDFAAARNFGLKKCIGEWFMFIDADEIFDNNMSEMIEFFSDRAQMDFYNSATHVRRDYIDIEKNEYDSLSLGRIVKRFDGLHFLNPVHEYFSSFPEPRKELSSFSNHWGYAYENQEQKSAKKKRNLDILFAQLEKTPDNIKILCEIFEALPAESADREGYILKAAELSAKSQASFIYVRPYQNIMRYYLESAPQKTVDYADKYIESARSDEAHLIDAYAYKAFALLNLQEYSQIFEAVQKYNKYFDMFEKGELSKDSTLIFPLRYNNRENRIVLNEIADLSMRLGNSVSK